MRRIEWESIVKEVEKLCIHMNIYVEEDLKELMEKALLEEDSPLGKTVLKDLLENQEVARREMLPICQDTGMVVAFVEVGQDLQIANGSLTEAINEGVRRGYEKGYLRRSVVACPLQRKNTGDNTPAIIYYDLVEGDQLKITLAAKGFGSENMSGVKMLKPIDGAEGVKNFVLETIQKAGGNCCPPIIVGVGIGGTFDKATQIAKKALLRKVGKRNDDGGIASLEEALLKEINNLGIGPQGFGGKTTALAVHVETFPTHIAGLPVAVNINCHASRHGEIIL
ncbi:fumarate hydratase [Alkaliphilus hydrothermalis]|uniref:Fumarate hydratase subunit alpha n=1 Tax=Alkaliphilus hydrothermalis TaxID=1482730 RepID=A0ABS2NST1_9FIRM|nr:fumarate hydratase [Alkaliphilus hydrothermalis]MBM7615971.1 fumarate hydratase subunit alpha [Alkaliphilus hydrothermalis]